MYVLNIQVLIYGRPTDGFFFLNILLRSINYYILIHEIMNNNSVV